MVSLLAILLSARLAFDTISLLMARFQTPKAESCLERLVQSRIHLKRGFAISGEMAGITKDTF